MARRLRGSGVPPQQEAPLQPFSAHKPAVSCREYAHAVLQQVVCETLKSIGFQRAEHSTILVLTEVLERYIVAQGQSGKAFTELAARTQSNLVDVHAAFIDLGVHVPSLYNYAERTRGAPFEIAIPQFPIESTVLPSTTAAVTALLDEQPRTRPSNIPSFCPPFPPAHTFINTPIYPTPERDLGAERAQRTREQRDVETAIGKFAVLTDTLPSEKISNDLQLLTTTKPPPFLAALMGENGVKIAKTIVPSTDTRSTKRPRGPGIVVTEATEAMDLGLAGDNTPQDSPAAAVS